MHAGLSSNNVHVQQGLEALLVEVSGLANRLKSNDPRETIPSASRSVLQVLQRYGPQTVPQIARTRFSSRQNIQIVVNRLQKEGLVEFAENPNHRRSGLVRLTEHGQIAVAEAAKQEAELSTKILPSFSQTELTSAADVLNRLRNVLDGKQMPKSVATKPSKGTRRAQLDNGGSQARQENADLMKTTGASSGIQDPDVTDGELPVNLL